jgi:hypothetical protein
MSNLLQNVDVVKRLLEEIGNGEDIDEAIHDIFSKRASVINNGGIEAQAIFLLKEFDGDIEAVQKYLSR